jgi:hypothetical protein
MIWTLTILGAIVVGVMAAFIVSDLFGSKALGGLIGTGSVVVVLFIAAAFATASAPAPTMGFSHAQLEADRQMTQQMAVSVDPGMQALMGQDSMLQRSANPAYVRALEEHIRQFDRMLGQVP